MLKTMTASIAFSALLVSTGYGALAAVRTHMENGPGNHEATRLLRDPPVAVVDCSIPALYHDQPYCFGGEGIGSLRVSGRTPTRGAY